jgi:hypothetical protein
MSRELVMLIRDDYIIYCKDTYNVYIGKVTKGTHAIQGIHDLCALIGIHHPTWLDPSWQSLTALLIVYYTTDIPTDW